MTRRGHRLTMPGAPGLLDRNGEPFARRGGYKDLSYRQAWDGFTKRYVFGGTPVARDRQYVAAIAQARNNARGAWRGCW